MKECLRQQRNKHFVKPTITFALRHLYELINFRHSAEVDVSPLTQHWTGSVLTGGFRWLRLPNSHYCTYCILPLLLFEYCVTVPSGGQLYKRERSKKAVIVKLLHFSAWVSLIFLLPLPLCCPAACLEKNSRVCRSWPGRPAQTESTHLWLLTSWRKKWTVAWRMTTNSSEKSSMYVTLTHMLAEWTTEDEAHVPVEHVKT